MPFNVRVGPAQIAIHQDQTVLITEENGQVVSPDQKGLYFLDTRTVSGWSIYANGEPWVLLNGGAIAYYAARIFLTNADFLTRSGPVAARTLFARAQSSDRRRYARGHRHRQLWPVASEF